MMHMLISFFLYFQTFILVTEATDNFSLSTSLHQRRRVPSCGASCTFKLCIYNGTQIRRPNAAFTIFSGPGATQRPYICSSEGSVGRIIRTEEARVLDLSTSPRPKLVPISTWRPVGLRPNFAKRFIGAYRIPSPGILGRDLLPGSTIGHLEPRGNQWEYLHDRCMILPIRSYEKVDDEFKRVQIVNVDGRSACVAFRTSAPDMHLELTWDTNDGLDLDLREPDGDSINRENTRTEAGKVNELVDFSYCPTGSTQGKENIVYFPGGDIEEGQYSVKVIHFESCEGKNTSWKLRILFGGIEQAVYTGISSAGGGALLETVTFSYP